MRKIVIGIVGALTSVGLILGAAAPATAAAPANVDAVQLSESDPNISRFAVTNHSGASVPVMLTIDYRPQNGDYWSADRVVTLAPGQTVVREYTGGGGSVHYVTQMERYVNPWTGQILYGPVRVLDRDRVVQ